MLLTLLRFFFKFGFLINSCSFNTHIIDPLPLCNVYFYNTKTGRHRFIVLPENRNKWENYWHSIICFPTNYLHKLFNYRFNYIDFCIDLSFLKEHWYLFIIDTGAWQNFWSPGTMDANADFGNVTKMHTNQIWHNLFEL